MMFPRLYLVVAGIFLLTTTTTACAILPDLSKTTSLSSSHEVHNITRFQAPIVGMPELPINSGNEPQDYRCKGSHECKEMSASAGYEIGLLIFAFLAGGSTIFTVAWAYITCKKEMRLNMLYKERERRRRVLEEGGFPEDLQAGHADVLETTERRRRELEEGSFPEGLQARHAAVIENLERGGL